MKPVRSSVACLVGFVLLAVFAWVGCSNKSSEEHASEAMSTGTESTATKQASAMLAPVKYRWTVYLQLKANGGGDVHGNDGAHLAVAEPPDTAHKVPHGNGKDGYEVTFVAMDADYLIMFLNESPFLDSTGKEIQCFTVNKGPAGKRTFRVRPDFPGCTNCCKQAKYRCIANPTEHVPDCPTGSSWTPCDPTYKEIGPVVDGDG